MLVVRKRIALCLKGNHFTEVSEEGFSVALKSFVPSNTAGYNEWALNSL